MATKNPKQIKSDLLLVHEGTTDLHILGGLMRHHGVTGYQPFELEGNSNLGAYFKALASSPHFKTPVPGYDHAVRGLAIVVDAETNAPSTFAAVRNALLNASLPAPAVPGTISEGSLRVGVYLVPDYQSPGMVETLCLQSVENDPAWKCLDEFFECVTNRGGTLPANMHKARAQAFLATRTIPNLPVGLAAEKGYWNFEHQAFAPLADFLRNLAKR